MLGSKPHEGIERGDYVFVTNNRLDFLRLHGSAELHNGLIVMVPNVARQAQLDLFERVLDHLEERPDLVNQVLEIEADGSVAVSPLAAG